MRAVLVATGDGPGVGLLEERYPAPILPLVDRPFIQHVVEFLIAQGVDEFDFVLSSLPEKIEELLGDGSRWGSRFRFHLAADSGRPYALLKRIGLEEERGPILFGHADRLPCAGLAQTRRPVRVDAPVLFCWRDRSAAGEPLQWTGWGWLPGSSFAGLPGGADEDELGAYLVTGKGSVVEVSRPLSVRSLEELLVSHRSVLSREASGLMLSGREVEEGIWLSRNVNLHPEARVIPPVYIGENCRIGAGVELGPNAVVDADCVLDEGCKVEGSVIFRGSYVGEGLELSDVIVDRDRFVNVRIGTAVSVVDDFILGNITESPIREGFSGTVSRAIAGLLLALAWPVLLVTALVLKVSRRGPVFHRREVVRLPVPSDETGWRTYRLWSFCPEAAAGGGLRHFFLRFLPALIDIARGKLRFVGVSSRTKEEIRALSPDWRALYLSAKAGIVTEAYVQHGAAPTEDELYSTEAFYSVVAGVRHDVKVLIKYFSRVLNLFSASERGEQETQASGGRSEDRDERECLAARNRML